jgi:hypothetical protein
LCFYPQSSQRRSRATLSHHSNPSNHAAAIPGEKIKLVIS